MLLIEGTDGLGKTTLAKKLQRELQSAYVHYGPLPEWWREPHYVTRCLNHAVYDRYHWSCWAYADVHPQPWRATVEICCGIDHALSLRNNGRYSSVLVYSSSKQWLKKNIVPKDEMFNIKQILEVNDRYSTVMEHFDFVWDVARCGWPNAEEIANATIRQWRDLDRGRERTTSIA